MKSGGFQVKSGRFQVKSTQNLINSDVSAKTLQFGGVHGGDYDPRFHEIQGHSPSPAFIKLNSLWDIWSLDCDLSCGGGKAWIPW